jgi:hypothetical protein
MTDADACVYRRVLYGRGSRGAGSVGGSSASQCSKVGKVAGNAAQEGLFDSRMDGWMAG